jgi:hypothetical protein
MRIFYADDSDPMLLDREVELHVLAQEMSAFLEAGGGFAEFRAEMAGDPAPYSEFLPGLRVHKAVDGPPGFEIAADRWLELTASPEDLGMLCAKLARATDGGHTHFYAGPVSLILEADDSWPGFHES